MEYGRRSRRQLLQMAAAVGGSLLAGRQALALETDPRKLGEPLGPYSERSPFEKAVRWRRESKTPETGSSFPPLHDSLGIVTPSALHYERHHSGVPTIDPAEHRLVIHGLVDRPLSLSMAEIRRPPSVTRIRVLECGGNSAGEWGATTGADVQRSYGLVSGSEWTGVPLSLLLAEAGVRPRASWVIAEGADACRMMRSIPLAKALENSLLAYGQNGELYIPYRHHPWLFRFTVLVRLAGDPGSAIPGFRRMLADIDPTQPMFDVTTLEQALAESITPRRFNLILLATFAAAAVMLAMIGIYGVIAYIVTLRTHEIGVRMALGAERRAVVLMVLQQGLGMTFAGLVMGIVAALGLTRFMASLRYDVEPTDPTTLALVAVMLAIAALAACGAPALKAARVDPLVSLRYE
jgi:DMSO/TMAO reductase YedYZ molybdopterin-dependent catalytic subunit